jgi:hypothetical protein
MINLLFEFNCDPTKRNKRKQTAFDVTQNQELVDILKGLHSKQKVLKTFLFLFFRTLNITSSKAPLISLILKIKIIIIQMT